jgi:hypothetical protein
MWNAAGIDRNIMNQFYELSGIFLIAEPLEALVSPVAALTGIYQEVGG